MVGWYCRAPGRTHRTGAGDLPALVAASGPGPLQSDTSSIRHPDLHGNGYTPRLLDHRLSVHYGDSFYVDTWPKALLLMVARRGAAAAHPLGCARHRLDRSRPHPSGSVPPAAISGGSWRRLVLRSSTMRRPRCAASRPARRHAGPVGDPAMRPGRPKEKLEHLAGVPYDPAGALELIDNAHRHARGGDGRAARHRARNPSARPRRRAGGSAGNRPRAAPSRAHVDLNGGPRTDPRH